MTRKTGGIMNMPVTSEEGNPFALPPDFLRSGNKMLLVSLPSLLSSSSLSSL
jgi:hypothetical protein